MSIQIKWFASCGMSGGQVGVKCSLFSHTQPRHTASHGAIRNAVLHDFPDRARRLGCAAALACTCARCATCTRIERRCRRISPGASRSTRTARPPTTPRPAPASSIVDTLVDAGVLLALTLAAGSRPLAGVDRRRRRFATLAQDVALIVAVALIGGARRTAARLVSHVRHRAALRLQPDDACACGSSTALKSALIGAALGVPLLACVLWLMARAGELWWLVCVGGWVAFQLLMLALYPTLIAPLFNKFVPLDGRAAEASASSACSSAAASRPRGCS